jgi:hypothetical protein
MATPSSSYDSRFDPKPLALFLVMPAGRREAITKRADEYQKPTRSSPTLSVVTKSPARARNPLERKP